MHFVKKQPAPACFVTAIENFDEKTTWQTFQNPEKKVTKQYILETEQEHLCIYCERDVTLEKTRLEHIKPQSIYPQDRFNYENLVISCSGKDYFSDDDDNNTQQAYQDYDIDSCDHYKDRHYDPKQFLNPTQIEDISEYFCFNYDTGAIFSESDKASYMINLLNLDNESLRIERINAKKALLKILSKQSLKNKKLIIKKLLKNNRAFISFLKAYQRSINK